MRNSNASSHQKNQHLAIMKISIPFNTMFLFILLALVFTSSCNKDNNDFIPTTEMESTRPTDNLSPLKTLQDTLNFLQAEAKKIEVYNTDYLNEMPGPDANISGIEKLRIAYPETGETREVEAQVVEGNMIVEGDIIIATEEAFRTLNSKADSRGIVSTVASERWTNGVIPYEIAPGHSKQIEIITASVMVTFSTNLTFVPRTTETDYLYFPITNQLNSWVGKQGGKQSINISSGASLGNVMHEMLHASGMEHEQTRCDRDNNVYIYTDNILVGREGNFDKECGNNRVDIYAYDYGSIMHYGPQFFSKDRDNLYTILPAWKGDLWKWVENFGKMGQRDALSPTDINSVNAMYPVIK